MLMSATTSADVDRLTKLVLHSPVALDLLGAGGGTAAGTAAGAVAGTAGGAAAEIEHLRLDLPRGEGLGGGVAEANEKLLHLLALLKLNLVQRKVRRLAGWLGGAWVAGCWDSARRALGCVLRALGAFRSLLLCSAPAGAAPQLHTIHQSTARAGSPH